MFLFEDIMSKFKLYNIYFFYYLGIGRLFWLIYLRLKYIKKGIGC